jgi:hypothetical protein
MLSNPFFKFLASLKLAVICLLSVAGVLATATVLESIYGTRAAHVMVYGTVWFYLLLTLLATNVFCAALSRWPWKKRQYGFVITHAGILTILFGSFLTMRFGVDGNLPVYEGGEDSQVILSNLKLSVMDEQEKQAENFPVPEYALLKQGNLMQVDLSPTDKLKVDEFIPRAVAEREITPSPLPGVGQPAVKVEVFNSRFRVGEWLLLSQPEKPAQLSLGPATLSFQKLWSSESEKRFLDRKPEAQPKADPIGYLLLEFEGKQFRIDIASHLHHWQPIASTPYKIEIDQYLPYAVVQNNELTNRSKEPVNPTVQLHLADASGVEEKHTVFANFPEFSTRHKTPPEQVPFPIHLTMVSAAHSQPPPAQSPMQKARGELRFAQTADDKRLLYQVRGSNGQVNAEGEVKVGDEVETGWMDLKFQVVNWLPAAVEREVPRYVEYIQSGGESNFLTSIRLREVSDRTPSSSGVGDEYMIEGSRRSFSVGNKMLVVRFGKERMTLPFRIFLEKFTVGNDPGTTRAATYQSNVEVRDTVNGVSRKALISMNEPLNYGGYTFYQASYQLQDGAPPISIFSVNYDPGRWLKYLGSIVMVLGIILMFYFNPQYWDLVLGSKKKEV